MLIPDLLRQLLLFLCLFPLSTLCWFLPKTSLALLELHYSNSERTECRAVYTPVKDD